MLKDYNTDVQRLFLEMMLEDAESYVRVQNIFNAEKLASCFRRKTAFLIEFMLPILKKYISMAANRC